MLRLYIFSGAIRSEEAIRLLKDRGFQFEVIDLSKKPLIFLNLGIGELPVLVHGLRRYEGLKQIQNFLTETESETKDQKGEGSIRSITCWPEL